MSKTLTAGQRIGVQLPAPLTRVLAPESELWTVLILALPVLAAGAALTVYGVLVSDHVPFIDFDYWWHLATGNWILDHHRVPTTDPFSWTHGGQNWVAHEWLSELILALTVRAGGYAAAIVLTVAIVGGGFWRLLCSGRFYGLSRRALFLLMLPVGAMIERELQVRPQIWGFALLCVLLAELAAYDTGHRRHLWFLPLLFVLWINIHLTALIGLGLLGLFAADRLLRRRLDRHLVTVCLLSLAAIFINPRGLNLLRYELPSYANTHSVRYEFIFEWMPPNFHEWTFIPFWLTVPLAMMAMWVLAYELLHARLRLWPAFPVVLFFAEALRSVRYIPIYGMLLVPFIGWLVWQRAQVREARPAEADVPLFAPWPRLLVAPLVAAALIVAIATYHTPTLFSRTPPAWGYPVGSTTVLLERYPHARLFNTYGWGGYLLNRLYPTNKVYIDGREEMYGDAFVRRYLAVERVEPGWQDILDQDGITVALVPRSFDIAVALNNDPGWKLDYLDANSAIFVRVR